MKTRKILSLILAVLMVMSAGSAFVASAEEAALFEGETYPGSEILTDKDGNPRAVIHDWKTTADDAGFTNVSNYYFSDVNNPRPKFATWRAANAPSMEGGLFKLAVSGTAMLEVDHLGAKVPSLSISSATKLLKMKVKTAATDGASVNVGMVMNRGKAKLLDGTTTTVDVRPQMFSTLTADGEWHIVTLDLAGTWTEFADTTDITDKVATPYTYNGSAQYRIDFGEGTGGAVYIDYIGFFKSEDDFAIYDSETRTFNDPEQAEAPTGLVALNASAADATDGKIAGVDETMEYSADNGATWTPVTGTEITGLAVGTYLVRVAAAGSVLASDSVALEISYTVAELPYLHNTFKKLASGEDVKIGYFGGSVTYGSGLESGLDRNVYSWRGLTGTWFKNEYPDSNITLRDAAIGGTGSRFGSFRTNSFQTGLELDKQAADLVFVEFAINDNYESRASETAEVKKDMSVIFNKVWTANPNADIIVVLTTDSSKNGKEYPTSTAHREIAEEYGIHVIDVGIHAYKKIRELEGLGADAAIPYNEVWLKYYSDTVHPLAAGYKIYADYIIEYLEEQKTAAAATLGAAYVSHEVDESVNLNREVVSNASITGFKQYATAEGFSGTGALTGANENAAVSFKFTGVNAYLWTSKNGTNGIYEVYVNGVKSDYYVDMWRNSTGGQQHAIPVFPEDKPYGTYEITLVLKAHPTYKGMANSFQAIAVYSDAAHALDITNTSSFIEFIETDREALGIGDLSYPDTIEVPGTFFKKTMNLWSGGVGTNAGALTFTTGTVDGVSAQGFVPCTTSREEGKLSQPDKKDRVVADGYSFGGFGVMPYIYKYVTIDYYYVLPEGIDTPSGSFPGFRVSAPKGFDGVSFTNDTGVVETNKWATAYLDLSEHSVWSNTANYPKGTVVTQTNLYPFGASAKGETFLKDGVATGEMMYISKVTFMKSAPKTPAKAPENLVAVPANGDNADGKITGVDDTMEYSADGGETWTPVTGTEITGLAAGAYLVRVAASEEFDASVAVTVTVVSTTDKAVTDYIEARYPDATNIVYVSFENGSSSNNGTTPSSAKDKVSSALSVFRSKGEGEYVVVLLDNYPISDATGRGFDLNNISGTVTFTTVPDLFTVGIYGSFNIYNAGNVLVVLDEFPYILGNPNSYTYNKVQSWKNTINGEINFDALGFKVIVTEGFKCAGYATATKALEADGTENTEVTPVTRTANIGFHALRDGGNGTYPGNLQIINGGKWSYIRATGYNQGVFTGDVKTVFGGNAATLTYGLAGHGPSSENIGNMYGTITGGTITNAYLGGASDGKLTGNAYLTVAGGNTETLNFGGQNTKATVSGDAIAMLESGTVGKIADTGRVAGNTVLVFANGKTEEDFGITSVASTIDYVIYAPATESGSFEVVTDTETGAFLGIKAAPANADEFVFINGAKATANGEGYFTLAGGTSVVTFGKELVSFKKETTEYNIGATIPASADTAADLANLGIDEADVFVALDIAITDAATGTPATPTETVSIKIPKSAVPGSEAQPTVEFTAADGTKAVGTTDSEYIYVDIPATALVDGKVRVFATALTSDDIGTAYYLLTGKYSNTDSALLVDVNLIGDNINIAGFSFKVNGKTVTDFAFESNVYEELSKLTVDGGNIFGGIATDPSAKYFAAKTDKVKVASFKIPMTVEEYKTFKTTDIETVLTGDVEEGFYDASNVYYVRHIAADAGVKVLTMLGTVVEFDNTVAVTFEGVNDEAAELPVTPSATAEMFNDYSFTAVTTAEISYKVGTATSKVLTKDEATGLYTIPGDEIIDDITISFSYGTPITDIALTGLEIPAPKATPDTDVVAEDSANYTVSAVTWTPDVTEFDYNTEYTASVVITPNEGYTVSDLTNVTIDGETATVVKNADGTITASVKFTTADRTPITTAALTGLTVPAPKATPDTDVVAEEGANYTVGAVTWTPDVTEFDYNTEYTASVVITPNEGYTVSDATAVTIDGNAATVTANADGTITASVKFTTADRADARNLEITIPAPSATGTPDVAVEKLPEGETESPFTVKSTKWTDEEGNVLDPENDKFGFEKVYSAEVTVELDDAYKLPADFTITVGDKTFTAPDGYTYDDATRTITFKVTFEKTGKNKATFAGTIKLLRASDKAPTTFAEIRFYDSANTLVYTAVVENADTRTVDNVITIDEITLDFAPGTYTAVISKNGYLDFTVNNITIAQMTSETEFTKATFAAELVAGDITATAGKDGRVDIEDFIYVMRAFADPSTYTEEAYNALVAATDIDEDGVVTMLDLGYIANSFAKIAADCKTDAVIG